MPPLPTAVGVQGCALRACASKRACERRHEATWRNTCSHIHAHACRRIQAGSRVSARASTVPREEVEQQDDASEAADELATFEQLGIDGRLTVGLESIGVAEPSPVQAIAIPAILAGNNCAVQSYTGSGKTLAYLLPALTVAIRKAEEEAAEGRQTKGPPPVHAVVVAPSRELAMQILRVARDVLPEAARSAVQQCIGGASFPRQMEALRKNRPILVVGTPGRLAEHSRAATLPTHGCGLLVLDEVDQLLATNFREDMQRIHEHVGRRVEGGRQTVMASATLSERLMGRLAGWCPSPTRVFLSSGAAATRADSSEGAAEKGAAGASGPSWGWGNDSAQFWGGPMREPAHEGTAGGVGRRPDVPELPPRLAHVSVVCRNARDRVDTARRIIHATDAERALVFMNFQQRLQDTAFKLAARGMTVAFLHGEMGKQKRQKILGEFRRGAFRALIVSDVLARGLDVPEVDLVVNLELPSNAAHYAHRAGRTARMGRAGTVVSVPLQNEQHVIAKLSRDLRVVIEEADLEAGRLIVRSGQAADGKPL